jgi:DNA-binding MarR family transcriptional regulator
MTFIHSSSANPDGQDLLSLLVAPTTSRVIYPRGRFEGLEPAMIQVLIAVKLLNRPTVRELESALAMNHGTTATAVKALQDHDLVESHTDDADGRVRRQTATALGEELIARFSSGAFARLVDAVKQRPASSRLRES